MRKSAFCICENKDADQLRGDRKLISAFVFASRIIQSLYFLNTKFHVIFCGCTARFMSDQVGNPEDRFFSQRGSYKVIMLKGLCNLDHLQPHRYMSLVVRNPVFGVSDQVRHKPGCTATEDG